MKDTSISKDKKRVAIYCRVSTADQSCERQELDLTAFAERAKFEVISIFKETSSGMKRDRQMRNSIIALAQARKIDAVVVTEMTRWGRSLVDLLHTLNVLNGYGVSVIAEKGFQFDLSTPQGKMLTGVLGSLAEFERDLTAERTKSGLAAARARGKVLGRPKGNKTDDKHRAAVLTLRSQGFNYRDIADKLKVGKNTIQRILSVES